ncbi:MAG: FkbM family methyltransferase [Proteobacteria bacterium]|nr:FkbM family methyltransferase [Pseudomonadota bacterium]
MPKPLNIPGISQPLQLYVHPDVDIGVSQQIIQKQIWEPYETALVVENLKEGDVFLDVGANIGYYSVVASHLVGENGKVVAYEPDESNYHLLVENIKLNRLTNVESFRAALSDTDENGFIYHCDDNLGDHRIYDTGDQREKAEIRIVDANQHVSKSSRHLDFIKIDTQGSETRIIKGLESLIRFNQEHLTMIIEYWPYGLRKAGSSGDELTELLFAFDLDCFIIDHIDHRLIPATKDDLLPWVRETDSDPENQGFMNLLFRS